MLDFFVTGRGGLLRRPRSNKCPLLLKAPRKNQNRQLSLDFL